MKTIVCTQVMHTCIIILQFAQSSEVYWVYITVLTRVGYRHAYILQKNLKYVLLYEQGVAPTGRNLTGPPFSVGRPTAHTPIPPAALQTTTIASKTIGPLLERAQLVYRQFTSLILVYNMLKRRQTLFQTLNQRYLNVSEKEVTIKTL